MRNHVDYSFNTQYSPKLINRLEESILRQYKRLNFGEDTVQYTIDSLNYTELPSNFPQQLQTSLKCLKLHSCGFFQMLTYSIFEFLIKRPSSQKQRTLAKIKFAICSKDFMEDSPSTKGLLLKGLQNMRQNGKNSSIQKPIAHNLWKNDCMAAFTQFWKQLLAKITMKNIVNASTISELDNSIFKLLASYLEVNFNVYYEKNGEFSNQVYSSSNSAAQSLPTLTIVVYCNQNESNGKNRLESSRLIQNSVLSELLSNGSSLQNGWSYIILQDPYQSQLQKGQISQIMAVDDSVQQNHQIMEMLKFRSNSDHKKAHLNFDQKVMQTTRTKRSTPRPRRSSQFQALVNLKQNLLKTEHLIQEMKKFSKIC